MVTNTYRHKNWKEVKGKSAHWSFSLPGFWLDMLIGWDDLLTPVNKLILLAKSSKDKQSYQVTFPLCKACLEEML